jgi:hypothetical protein
MVGRGVPVLSRYGGFTARLPVFCLVVVGAALVPARGVHATAPPSKPLDAERELVLVQRSQ